jgi:hypothetical protein
MDTGLQVEVTFANVCLLFLILFDVYIYVYEWYYMYYVIGSSSSSSSSIHPAYRSKGSPAMLCCVVAMRRNACCHTLNTAHGWGLRYCDGIVYLIFLYYII